MGGRGTRGIEERIERKQAKWPGCCHGVCSLKLFMATTENMMCTIDFEFNRSVSLQGKRIV